MCCSVSNRLVHTWAITCLRLFALLLVHTEVFNPACRIYNKLCEFGSSITPSIFCALLLC